MSTIEFLGQNLSAETYDELAFSFIRADWRECERDLFDLKWFDYRFMHPTEATYLYAHHYEIAFRRAFRTSFDAERAETVKVFKSSNIFHCDKATVSGLWRGRQCADGHGIPYDVFVSLAFKEVLRFWKQKHMPRPQHLYSDEVVARVMIAWDERQASNLYYSSHDAYKAENWLGLPVQRDHRAWLTKQAGKRPSSLSVLRRFFDEKLICADFLKATFPDRAHEILTFA